MARTTVDIDTLILNELKQLQKKEHCSLGQLVSLLLSEALNSRKQPKQASSFKWVSQPMHARVDLADKEAVYAVLDDTP
ncbi:MAG: putative antitoxin VapB48 [Nitrospirales bacterium]|nr:MAG: putative antitoxin VapB48 [Nitrospirales bacterium]